MAGLLGFLAAGAAQGAGAGIVAAAKAKREAAIAELENSRLVGREDANRDFQRSERIAGQDFVAGQNALERATAAPKPQRTFQGPDGNHYYEDGSRVLPNVDAAPKTFRPASAEEAAQYGSPSGQIGPDGRFYPNNPPSGMSVEVGPDGATRIVQGPGVGKPGGALTEGQSKDTVYATRARGALPLIDEFGDALTNPAASAVSGLPGANYVVGDRFQRATQAGNEFLQAILRKDTGAAITAEETREYGSVYLPRPGDSPETLEQKRTSRNRALAAIEAGMPPQAILNQERALLESGNGSANQRRDESGVPIGGSLPTAGGRPGSVLRDKYGLE